MVAGCEGGSRRRYDQAVSRRALTLLLATVLAVGLAMAGVLAPVPYVSLSPGPAYDTLGKTAGASVITIVGRPTFPTDGRLDLLTVSVADRITLLQALRGWLSSREQVVPREILFPADQSRAQVDQQNAQQMRQSQDAATTAALTELGVPATRTVVVSSVQPGGTAAGQLQAGDVLTTVDGTKVTSATDLRAAIGRHAPGQAVTVGYLRSGKPGIVTIPTARSTDPPVRPVIGIAPEDRSDFPVKVTISLRDVGGPSAGLMFALGIIDKLGKDSLTGGRTVAGTGEISNDGKVGPIGGVTEKLLAAKGAGAAVFLVPTDNCGALKGDPNLKGITLIKVGTLKEALTGLRTLRDGGTPASC